MEIKTKFDVGDKAYIREIYNSVSEVTIEAVDVYAWRDVLGNLHINESYKIERGGREKDVSGRMTQVDFIFASKAEAAKTIIEEKRNTIKEIEREIAELERE